MHLSRFSAKSLLQAGIACRQYRADGGAGAEDKINDNRPVRREEVPEAYAVAVLIDQGDVRHRIFFDRALIGPGIGRGLVSEKKQSEKSEQGRQTDKPASPQA